jgi:hypothetical protein
MRSPSRPVSVRASRARRHTNYVLGLVRREVRREERNSGGFYAVVANEKRGTVSLRDAKGNTLAEGDLQIVVGPSTGGTAERIDVSITEVHFGKKSFKSAAHVTLILAQSLFTPTVV